MNTMKHVLFFLLALSFKAGAQGGKPQPQHRGAELLEILRIAEVYRQTPSLSFDMVYTYHDTIDIETPIETVTGSSKISNGNYWTILDSTEFIQGYRYSVSVFHQDSTIVVGDRQEHSNVMQLPLLDSLFRGANVDSILIYPVDDSTNEVNIIFETDAAYQAYKLFYHPQTYLVRQVQYYLRGIADDRITTGTAIITLNISNYSEAPVDQQLFREDRLIQPSPEGFQGKGSFAGFKIINNITR
jgi:hypothetical protein